MPSHAVSRRPCAPLERWIERVWTSQRRSPAPHSREWNLPSGRADLVVPLTQATLRRFAGAGDAVGQAHAGGLLHRVHEQPTLRDTASPLAVVGAQFRPGGLAAFIAAPGAALGPGPVALDELWPGFAAALQDRLGHGGRLAPPVLRLQALEQALLARLRPAAGPDPWLDWVVAQLAADANRVGAVQRASGCSPQRFIQRYREATGLAPKRHAALLRFATLVQALGGAGPGPALAEAAACAGYADQAHMSREFRRFAGCAPGEYRRAVTGLVGHMACR